MERERKLNSDFVLEFDEVKKMGKDVVIDGQ